MCCNSRFIIFKSTRYNELCVDTFYISFNYVFVKGMKKYVFCCMLYDWDG